MFGLGDDLIIEFPGESWLLSLHLLVMFLFFLILLAHLTIHGFDVADADDHQKGSIVAADHFTSQDHRKAKQIQNNSIKLGINCSQDKYKVNTIKGHLTTSTRTNLKEGKEQDEEEEMGESSPMVLKPRTLMHFCVNPCYYLEQFLKPFLKCLGLESTYHDS